MVLSETFGVFSKRLGINVASRKLGIWSPTLRIKKQSFLCKYCKLSSLWETVRKMKRMIQSLPTACKYYGTPSCTSDCFHQLPRKRCWNSCIWLPEILVPTTLKTPLFTHAHIHMPTLSHAITDQWPATHVGKDLAWLFDPSSCKMAVVKPWKALL
jgi:hypothetical protein